MVTSTTSPFRWRSVSAAVASVVIAAALRVWPMQLLGARLAWLTFYPTVMVAALYGGFVAGLLATLLSCLAVLFLLPVFAGHPLIQDAADWLGLAVFAVTCAAISAIVEATRRARVREQLARERGTAAEAALARLNAQLELEARKRTAALQESEERFRLLIEGVRDYAIMQLDPGGHIVSWNAGAERIKGYRAEEILGQHFSRFYPAEDVARGKPARELEQAATGRFEGEVWRVRKDGTRFWAHVILTALRDEAGTLRGFAKITRDITERKRVEAALELERAKLAAAFENTGMGLVLSDAQGGSMVMNAAALKFHGYASVAEMHARVDEYATEWELRYPDGRPMPFAEWPLPRALRGDFVQDYEARLRHGRTGYAWVGNYTAVPVRNAAGEVSLIVLTILDITARKRAEEEIHALNANLERRVAERTRQLEEANQELASFSHSVSHDLRSPLRGIDGFSQVLEEDYGDKLDEAGRGHLARVRAAAQRMSALIDDLLKLAKITRAELHRQPVDLSGLARTVAAGLHQREPRRPVAWAIADGLAAEGDPQLLRVALENLFGNAWKFSGRRPEARIEFGAMAGGPDPAFFVRDNGAGFDMAHASKLFGAFQRLHTLAEFEGTGVGLATVQRIIHRHGGRVWAEGAVNHGATFYFTLVTNNGGDPHD